MIVFICKLAEKYTSTLSTPRGIRIPVTSVKGRCPRPLDDGGIELRPFIR